MNKKPIVDREGLIKAANKVGKIIRGVEAKEAQKDNSINFNSSGIPLLTQQEVNRDYVKKETIDKLGWCLSTTCERVNKHLEQPHLNREHNLYTRDQVIALVGEDKDYEKQDPADFANWFVEDKCGGYNLRGAEILKRLDT